MVEYSTEGTRADGSGPASGPPVRGAGGPPVREAGGGPVRGAAGDPHRGADGLLVGRGRELAELRAALGAHRLVTVTGAAGIGKSRLAVTVAASPAGGAWQAMVRVRWHDGVPVGPRALTARVVRALTAASGAPPGAHGTDVTAAACAAATGDGLLLVLDDVDPVHGESVGLVQRLLLAVPALRVLVTARRPLGLGDEQVLALAPLEVEAPAGGTEPSAAVELFLAATAGGPPVAEDDLPEVARVCRLLEGVPLAIELAAGRLGDLPVRELAARLEVGQCWLAGRGPVLRRHRSLRASMGAVHTLCAPEVRRVWQRAGVFAGAFTEPAAVFLCAGAGVEPDQVPSCLTRLCAVGVLRALGEPGAPRQPRYRMTRAARDFGLERLRGAGELPSALARHAVHYRGVAAVAETLWRMGLQRQAAGVVRDEQDDLMALVSRATPVRPPRTPVGTPAKERRECADRAEAALEAVLHLWFWWAAYERGAEGAALLLRLVPLLPSDSPLVARGRWLAAWLTAAHDPVPARRLLELAWPAAVMAGDDALVGRIAHVHGTLAWQRRDPDAAAAYYRQAADWIPETASGGPPPGVSLAALAVVQAHAAPDVAVRTARRALAQEGGRDDPWAAALAHYAHAFADHRAGRTGHAWHRARRALSRFAADAEDAPQARTALQRLIDHLEQAHLASHPPAENPRPYVPLPRVTAVASAGEAAPAWG
ncbi:ATP-binding protein [Streptomyces sp. NPDC053431]|uniref:ATP-binding protein n=1 Tax=Streptomyces sp. NPDC053431 TaxID=3365703 RepID=UPI0037D8DBE6